jgi:uncharacterized protein
MLDTRTRDAGARPADREVRLVDCDVHPAITPPALAARMSTRWRRHLERFGRRTPPVTEYYPRARNAGMRRDSWPDAPGSVPGSDPELTRRQLLDEFDVDFAVLDLLNLADCYERPEVADELCRAMNDWLAEEWLDRDPRFVGSICIAHEYPDLAVREIERRAGDGRWVQVMLPTAAQEDLGSRKYWRVYEAAAAHGLPIAPHNGGYRDHHGAGWPSYYLEEHLTYAMVGQEVVTSLICEGTFDAIPSLRVVMTEAGFAWVAPLRWALDEAWRQLHDEEPGLARRPSEYLHDNFWFTTQPMEETDEPEQFHQMVEQGRLADRLVFATDYPHWDFDSPTQALPRGLPAELRAGILAGNACELYGLPRGTGESGR